MSGKITHIHAPRASQHPPHSLPGIRKLDARVHAALRSAFSIPDVSSAVEELVCNALDAGAATVDVVLDLQRLTIHVHDSGRGMNMDDTAAAATRFCSSKVPPLTGEMDAAEALSRVSTYGFRGEALASLAALSTLSLFSKTESCLHVSEKVLHGAAITYSGRARASRPLGARPCGTSVTVSDLFFNLPLRRQSLLDSLRQETERCRVRLERLALVHPTVHFSLYDTSKSSRLLQVRCWRASAAHVSLWKRPGCFIVCAVVVSLGVGICLVRHWVPAPSGLDLRHCLIRRWPPRCVQCPWSMNAAIIWKV
jgi:DNA mismatch repair protein MutL